MIDVKLLIEQVINEIAVADDFNQSYDSELKKYVVGVYDRPPTFQGNRNNPQEFGAYLQHLQDWAARNLDLIHTQNAVFDLKRLRFVEGVEPTAEFSDDYPTFDDFVEDQIHPFRYFLISPGHIARYVLGDDLANRIVIQGRQ